MNALWSYTLKFNLTIDDICKQPTKELEVIKEALKMGFEYLDHPLAYKHVRVQIAVTLKTRWGSLKRMNLKGEHHSWNCPLDHWNQLRKILMKYENKKRAVWMKGNFGVQKNASRVGWVGVVGGEERMVYFTPFPLLLLFDFATEILNVHEYVCIRRQILEYYLHWKRSK